MTTRSAPASRAATAASKAALPPPMTMTSQDSRRTIPGHDRQGLRPDLLLLVRALGLALGLVFDVLEAMHRDVEDVAVGIHGAVLGIGPRRRPAGQRLVEALEPLFDLVEILDLEAEM